MDGPRPFHGPFWVPSRTYDDRGGGHLLWAHLLIVAILCALAIALNFGWFRLIL